MTNNYYVYEHWRPDKNVCFYVGKGRGKRAYSREARNARWKNIINKLERDGYSYEVRIVFEGLTEEEAFSFEKERIAFWRGIVNLANMTDGGEGSSGCTPSKETRAKIGEASKNRPLETRIKLSRAAQNRSIETRIKMSESLKGRKLSAEHRAKLSEASKNRSPEIIEKIANSNRGKKHSLETRAKIAEANRNRSPEVRAKLSEANRRRKKT